MRAHIGHIKCNSDKCQACATDTYMCATCGGIGGLYGSLPTECPGKLMDADTEIMVHERQIDYMDGRWIEVSVYE